jgi:hypothetical protein
MTGSFSVERRTLIKAGAAVPLAAGIAAAIGAALPGTAEAATDCNGVYECDEYFFVDDAGHVYLCVDLCDIITGAYCYTDCTQCG